MKTKPKLLLSLRPPFLSMRHVATLLLFAVIALYVPARLYESVNPFFGYLRAFAEAAMVGALADWFAVSALFRRPLGLPIPHTAVVPRNKERIGTALGGFIERNFLATDMLTAKLEKIDFAALLAEWLDQPSNRAKIADYLSEMLPGMLDSVKDEQVRRFIFKNVSERVRRFEAAPLTAEILGMLTAENRHQLLIDEMLRQVAALLKENEPLIREKVRARTTWLWRQLSVDDRVATRIMEAAEEALTDLADDEQHPWRLRFDRTVRDFIQELRTSPEYREKADEIKEQLLLHPAVQEYLDGLWPEIKRAIQTDAGKHTSVLRARLRKGLAMMARGLLNDHGLRTRLNEWTLGIILDVVESRRHEVAKLIATTVREWDPDTMASKIEQEIGDDLQYIRINGTIIGGLAGLMIHGISQLAF